MDENKQDVSFDPKQAHLNQSRWQIYLPLALTGAAAGAGLFLMLRSSQNGTQDLRIWADIAAILIILSLFFIILALIAFTLFGSFGLLKISGAARAHLPKINRLVSRLSSISIRALGHLQKAAIETEVYSSLLSHKRKK